VVVAVAVSHASLASLETLFSSLPHSAGAAYVVVFSQTEGLVPEEIATNLGRLANRPALVAAGHLRPLPDHIYIASLDGSLVAEGQELVELSPEQPPGHRGSIDSLMTSLAEAYGPRAIGVFLHGIGPDGLAGIVTLKENDGLALGERPPGQPASPDLLDPNAVVDATLPVEEIARRIEAYVEDILGLEASKDREQEVQRNLPRIAAILRDRTGHDFHGYKQNTFARRVQRRMQVRQLDAAAAYLAALRTDPDEVHHLFQDLLIGVTSFFRDKAEFTLLEREVIPKLFEGRTAEDTVRVWVLGCATGEEAYSIGMLMREHAATLENRPRIQIFATDLDGRALTIARTGRYAESIDKHLSPERLARWFHREGATYSVAKELREMCVFSQQNVIRDAPFSRIDLVSCRNLLIYLTPELQERVIPLFHFALRPGGFLFLGSSENVTKHAKLFAPIERRHRIFRRLEALARPIPEFPLATIASVPAQAGALMRAGGGLRLDASARKRADQIIGRYAPSYVLVDQQYDVLRFSEHTGGLLQPSGGAASLNLLSLVHRQLRIELRTALRAAAAEQRRVEIDVPEIVIDGKSRRLDVIVEPLTDGEAPGGFLVFFRDKGAALSPGADNARDAAAQRDDLVAQLESDLRVANERLQATVEELESTNEELKASNEEYQSLNEELQSTNEELETSKEELQSVNEELHTVNGELGFRVNELARANADLKSLLENTQIATVFLDNDMRVKSFTASIGDVYHLIETDLGRPITDIAPRVHYPDLREDVRRVLRTLAPVEREVAGAADGHRFLVRVLPYRSGDNFIAGVVITFADISEVMRVQAALAASEARYRMIVDSATDYAIITMDAERRITGWNPGAAHIFGWSEGEMLGKSADTIFTPEDRKAHAPEAEASTAVGDGRAADQRWHLRLDGGRFWGAGVLMPLRDPTQGFVKILHDRTEEREHGERQKLLMAELQHRVKNILAVVRSIAARTLENTNDLDDFSAHFDGRLRALGRTQNVLTRTIGGRIDLDELVREELLSHAAHDGGQVEISGVPITLKDRSAEIFALALHELATNAVKYGALSQPKGLVRITWRVLTAADGARLSLDWRESGVPALDPSPTRHGFGRDLIERGLPYELGAATSLEFLPGGVRCTIELPLDDSGAADTDSLRWSNQP
jgi:two-component system CheB/CheR fusion protein